MLELLLSPQERHQAAAQAVLRYLPAFRVLLSTRDRLVLLTDGLRDQELFELQDLLEL
jgi:hypothetical protein